MCLHRRGCEGMPQPWVFHTPFCPLLSWPTLHDSSYAPSTHTTVPPFKRTNVHTVKSVRVQAHEYNNHIDKRTHTHIPRPIVYNALANSLPSPPRGRVQIHYQTFSYFPFILLSLPLKLSFLYLQTLPQGHTLQQVHRERWKRRRMNENEQWLKKKKMGGFHRVSSIVLISMRCQCRMFFLTTFRQIGVTWCQVMR